MLGSGEIEAYLHSATFWSGLDWNAMELTSDMNRGRWNVYERCTSVLVSTLLGMPAI